MSISVLVERMLPLSADILRGLASGDLTQHGGVIRNDMGQIVKHLVFPQQALEKVSETVSPVINSSMSDGMQMQMGNIESQMMAMAAVNIIAIKVATQHLSKKLDNISDQLDTLTSKLFHIAETLKLQQFMQGKSLQGKAKGAIENAVLAIITEHDKSHVRQHLIPLRLIFVELEMLLNGMLKELDTLDLVKNIDLLMTINELANEASFVLSQAHFKFEEDNIGHSYLSRMDKINALIREKIQFMKTTGAFGPHIISDELFSLFKSQIVKFKENESTTLQLINQSRVALEHKVPYQALLTVDSNEVMMLDPIAA